MKKIFVIFLAVVLSFVGISSISASDKLIRTETKDKVMFIQDKDGEFAYSWSFDKAEFKQNEFEFDMKIKFKSPNKHEINSLISKNMKKEYVSFNYHGDLPGVATIKIPTTKFSDGDRLNLYYYNDQTNEIETVNTNLLVKNGYITFDIDHCSDYFLTLSIVKEASGKSNNGVIIIGMLVIIVGLVGYTIFKGRK